MLKKISHSGSASADEVLFTTPFDYMFPELARSAGCLLPEGQDTTRALLDLGDAMAVDALPAGGADPFASSISSFFTYFGQFIDHDLTARTDRETDTSAIFAPDGGALPIAPHDPADVVRTLKNGRRPQFDLDSAYGDGPPLHAGPGTSTNAAALYDGALKFKLQHVGSNALDLPRPLAVGGEFRPNPRVALVADARNDENINVSQIHVAFLAFHNAIMDGQTGIAPEIAFARARQYVRWTYQFIVINQYLKTVCLPAVVEDVLRNGPLFYGPVTGGQPLFMPLEFSVAAFRFGHSMIRPSYTLRGATATIEEIVGVSNPSRPGTPPVEILESISDPSNAFRLRPEYTVDWHKFFGHGAVNLARKIDPVIAHGLGSLTFIAPGHRTSVMAHLAKRNLLRGFSLSIPTGQAIAAGCGTEPLTEAELVNGLSPELTNALSNASFSKRTPLWFYLLREAQVQTGGTALGVVGSRLVAECMVGMMKKDPNSYLNQFGIARNITKHGISVPTASGRVVVGEFQKLLQVIGLL